MFQKIGKYRELCVSSRLISMATAPVQAADDQVKFFSIISNEPCTINSDGDEKSI